MIIPEDIGGQVETVVPVASDKHSLNSQTGYQVKNVSNFRNLGGFPIQNSTRLMKKGLIFRSAAPTYASEEDKVVLLEKLDIITLIDMRTSFETKHLNFGRAKYEDNFLTFSAKTEDGGKDIDTIDETKEEIMMVQQGTFSGLKRLYKGTPRVGPRRTSLTGVNRKRYSIPLINTTYFYDGVLPQAPASTKLKCSIARVFLRSDKVAAFILLRHLNSLGLFEMYKLTAEHTKREILTIFKILKNPDNYPISFYCALGKDRTGMISALLLSTLGVPRELIIENYHETELHLKDTIESIKAYFNRIGLDNEEFVMAPKHVMERFLAFIDEKYGSVPKYMDSIGFTYEDQQQLFDCLTYEPVASNLSVIKEEEAGAALR